MLINFPVCVCMVLLPGCLNISEKKEYAVRIGEAAMAILQLETSGTEGSQELSPTVMFA